MRAFATATDVSVTRVLGYVTPSGADQEIRTGRFGFGVGPQIGYVVRAEDHYTGTVARENDLSYTVSLWSRVNRWDAGVNALAEFNVAPRLGLQSLRVRAGWYHAFREALSSAPGTNDTFMLGIGLPSVGPSARRQRHEPSSDWHRCCSSP
jgi:hypothetical protein